MASVEELVEQFTRIGLVKRCETLGLNTDGTKEELAGRIMAHREGGSQDITGVDDYADAIERDSVSSRENVNHEVQSVSIHFKDVQDYLPTFSGAEDVCAWVVEFETSSQLFKWHELHKLIYAKRVLQGAAKAFVKSIPEVSSWKELKCALVEEFEEKVSSASVHESLRHRKKKTEETFTEYIYAMCAIGKKGHVEEESLCEYIVKGIDDDPLNKACLIAAKTIKELKGQMKGYEKLVAQIREQRQKRPVITKITDGNNSKQITAASVKCRTCGKMGHFAKECPNKVAGPVCFGCGRPGHRARECKDRPSFSGNTNLVSGDKGGTITMRIGTKELNTLFDTGSQYNLLSEEAQQAIRFPSVTPTTMTLNGFGGTRTAALGTIVTTVTIDQNEYKEIQFYVVPTGSMCYEAVIGREALKDMEATVTKDGIKVRPSGKNKEEECVFSGDVFICEPDKIVVPPKFQEAIDSVVSKYNEAWCEPKLEDGPVKLRIVPNESIVPFRHTPGRLAYPEEKAVNEQVDEWLSKGIVQASTSDFASRVVVVKKKDGSNRVCVDFRKLNSMILKDGFPIPRIDEVLEKLQSAKWFSVMDLENGFFHVPVDEASKKYTAFVTKKGFYEFNRAPFGLCNSPAVFMRFVYHVFLNLINEGVLEVYMDDLIVYAKTAAECLWKTEQVLMTAAEHGLAVKWKKCKFMQSSVHFLGHYVEIGMISPSAEKINAVTKFSVPKNVKAVQAFLGLTGFFRKFVKNYAHIARPLTNLLRKDTEFVVGSQELLAFNQLKEILASEPVLRLYDREAETELHTDASKEGYGAVLLQRFEGKLHPVAFWSKKTTAAEERKHSYVLEAKAVFLATKKFRRYLLGVPFKLVTDCNAFKQTLKKAEVPSEVLPWVMYLQDFTFEVEHRPGSRLRHVDCLSRYPYRVMVVTSEVTARIKNSQQKDEMVKAICEILRKEPYGAYHLKGGILYYLKDGQDLIVAPRSMQKQLIQEVHNNGHFGSQKTIHTLTQKYWIPQVEMKVKQVIGNCVKCILYNKKLGLKEGYLHPIEKGDKPLHTLHIDHVGPMDATSKQYRYILTMVDGFSKFVWLYPTKTTSAEETLRKIEEWSSVFGNPERVVTDRGAAFTANSFAEYMNTNGIEHVVCTTGVPRGNGQAERVNRTLLNMLSKLSAENPCKWFKEVPRVQRAINAHGHATTGKSPFELMFGVRMKNLTDDKLGEILQQEIYEEFERDRQEMRYNARKAIEEAQLAQKKEFDKKRKPESGYVTGDLVAIRRTQFVAGRKLASEYLGPYQIVTVNRNGRFKVRKAAECEGPNMTTTSIDNMKLWAYAVNEEELESSEEEA